jgi:CheY-like chemotaxis protein
MANLLLGTELTQDQREYAQILNQSSENLISLVNDILDFTKLEERKLTLHPTTFKLEGLMSEVCGIFRIAAQKRNLRIEQEISADLPLYLRGDTLRLKQIILNLINNSVKFTQNGYVTVQASGRSGAVRFTVTDTGTGIPAEFTDLLFTPFRQLDPSATREVGGTGLGLSICRELVTLMSGEIGFNPVPEGGASFWFELPLTESLPPENSLPQEEQKDIRGKRVLVVEDNPVNQLITRRMLEKLGHHALVAGTGIEALTALEKEIFDLVLMDCQMPIMNGFETTQRIRSTSAPWHSIPIVAMTAHAVGGDRERCLAVGMTDYLAKPIKLSDLAGIVSLR